MIARPPTLFLPQMGSYIIRSGQTLGTDSIVTSRTAVHKGLFLVYFCYRVITSIATARALVRAFSRNTLCGVIFNLKEVA